MTVDEIALITNKILKTNYISAINNVVAEPSICKKLIILKGKVKTYHHKQLALSIAMRQNKTYTILNNILVEK